MVKIVCPGSIPINGRYCKVFCQIKFEDKELSITGVEGPQHTGNCKGSCGQIEMHMDVKYIDSMQLSVEWTKELLQKFIEVWRKWHLNDMRAGCEHQRAENWGHKTIEVGGEQKKAVWVYEHEHPEGVLCKPCPVCGYKYGTRWLHEDVPQSIIDFLWALPDATSSLPPCWQ